jgi:hypothetical protein
MNNPNVSWIGIIYYALPNFLRKEKFIRYMRSAFTPLMWLYVRFLEKRNLEVFKMRYTGQVISLEHMLNARFNNGLPAYTNGAPTGIFIGAGAITFNPPFIYKKSEGITEDLWLYNKTETVSDPNDIIWLYTKQELNNLNYDFTVNVPFSVGDVTINQELFFAIRAWVNFYRQAGQNYIIINY